MRAKRKAGQIRSGVGVVAVAGAAVLALAGPAVAQAVNPTDDDQIVLHGTLVVPDGQTVGSAVIFDGPATIDGTVSQTLVVFHGDVQVTGTVRQDVVVLNGDVVIRSGAEVGGDIISTSRPTVEEGATVIGDTTRVAARLDLGDIGFASRIAWWIGFSASTLILGLILLLLAPGLDGALARTADRRGAAIAIGVGWFFLLPVAAVALLVTVVGIPLGLFTLLGLALLYTVGYVAGAIAIGRMLVKAPTSRYLALLVGLGLLRALALIPVIAWFVFMGAAIVGFGALVVAARRKPVGELPAMATPPPPPPPMPA